MDINYLLKREQISLMRAKAAKSIEARVAHEGLASGYRAKLRRSAFLQAETPRAVVGA